MVTYTKVLCVFADFFEGMEVSANDDGRVDVSLKEALDSGEHFTGEDDDGGGTVTDFFVLGTAELNHTLGGGMGHIDLQSNLLNAILI